VDRLGVLEQLGRASSAKDTLHLHGIELGEGNQHASLRCFALEHVDDLGVKVRVLREAVEHYVLDASDLVAVRRRVQGC